jgi:hypothetical protein
MLNFTQALRIFADIGERRLAGPRRCEEHAGEVGDVMSQKMPQVQRVYTDINDEGTVTCPMCQKSKRAHFTTYKHAREVLKVKCACGCVFGLVIEQRKYYRKKTSLHGQYTVVGATETGSLVVEDLSLTGIGFQTRRAHHMQVGDRIAIRFTLDNPRKTEIYKTAVVRRMRDTFVGAEFCAGTAYDKELGFYLMPA